MRRKCYVEPRAVVIHMTPPSLLVQSITEDNNADAKKHQFQDEETDLTDTTMPLWNVNPWESGL